MMRVCTTVSAQVKDLGDRLETQETEEETRERIDRANLQVQTFQLLCLPCTPPLEGSTEGGHDQLPEGGAGEGQEEGGGLRGHGEATVL